jgi:tetratricopeptide (TPR) repeat protein
MMVLVQVGRPDQALKWAEQAAARDPALGWFYNHRKGWAYLVLGRFAEAVDALSQTEFNDAHLLLAISYARRSGENDQGQSRNHVERLAPGIFLPRSCNR